MHFPLYESLQVVSFWAIILGLIPLIGKFWSLLVEGRRTFVHPALSWLENLSYRFAHINPMEEMDWIVYGKNLIFFNLFGALILFLILVFQSYLPLNSQNFPNVSSIQAINIAISFMTNTNWQSYAGETTLSYGSQMMGLTVQNFLSAATGSAVLMALIRGISRKTSGTIGNFWADLVRSIVYLLLPLSTIFAVFLVSQGVIQTFSTYQSIETLEHGLQVIPLGPVASQVAIKQLGTNGGGFFNANSAHPFENPTPLSNLFELVSILVIPASMVYAYGLLIGSKKHAWCILSVMFSLWLGGFCLASFAEKQVNPILDAYPVWEGKEVRLGNTNSLLWATITTATSNGSVNMSHESLSPLAGGVVLFNMMLGEVVFGGMGVGLCGMLMFILLTVFLCGLMVGRTPEYVGKKLNKKDIQWIVLAVLTPNILILLGTGISSVLPIAQSSLSTLGPCGFTELLYAFTSSATNNGSAFSGLNSNTDYFNLVLALTMFLGRLSILIPTLAIAGSFGAKKTSRESTGTLSTNSLLFCVLLFSVILIVAGLSFLPAIALGPIVEYLLMLHGETISSLSRY